ncbi:Cytochrome P450 6d4 [Carabus blaptoides fortunei]
MFFYIILWSSALAIVVLCVYLYFLYDFDYWTRYGVACIAKPSFPFGNAWAIFRASQCSGMELFKWYKQIQGPFAGAYILNAPVLFVKDPEILRRILVKDFNYFCDRGMYIDEKKEPLSGHLFRLSGDRWRSVRSKLSPAFTIGKLKMMFDTLVETGKQWQETLENTTEHGTELNISDHSLRFISDAIASTIFGIQVNSFQNSRNDWISLVHEQLYQFTSVRYYIFLLTTFAPQVISCLKFSSIYKNTNEKMFQLVREVVQYRETNKVSRNDFMQLLIQLKNTGNVNKEDGDDYEISPASGDGITLNEMSAAAYSMFFAGPYAGVYFCNNPVLFVKDPELLKHVLVKDFDKFRDRGVHYDETHDPLTGHLFRLGGHRWRTLRKKLSPTFTSGKLKMMFPILIKCAEQLRDSLASVAETGQVVDMWDISSCYTSDVISNTAFGIETNSFKDSSNDIATFIKRFTHMSLSKFNATLILLTTCVPQAMKLFKLRLFNVEVSQFFMDLIRKVINYRETNKVVRNDFMQLMIQLRNTGRVTDDDTAGDASIYDQSVRMAKMQTSVGLAMILSKYTVSTCPETPETFRFAGGSFILSLREGMKLTINKRK